ncbi:MAG: hypothetical protein BroJett025_08200 [Patescibacteria group bacterium]|nr:MAG: hypothetical protein BroJett025_08200 [Patescibacteria group bacterium]
MFKNKLSIRYIFTIPFIIFILFTSSLTAFIAYQSNSQSIQSLSAELFSHSSNQIKDKITAVLSAPQNINKINKDAIESGAISITEKEKMGNLFFSQLLTYDSVGSIEYEDIDSNNVGVIRNIFNFDYGIGMSGPETQYTFTLYEKKLDGSVGEIIFELPNYNEFEKSWFDLAIKADKPIWTPVYLWPNGDVGLDAVTTVKNKEKTIGVLDASLTLKELSDFLINAKTFDSSTIFIIEKSGLLIATSDTNENYKKNGEMLERLHASESKNETVRAIFEFFTTQYGDINNITADISTTFTKNTTDYFVNAYPVTDEYGLDWILVQVTPTTTILGTINENTRVTAVLIAFFVGLSIILALILSRYITKPLIELSKTAIDFSRGNFKKRAKVSHKDEIGELAYNFNYMAQLLEKNIESLEEKEASAKNEKEKVEAILHSISDGIIVVNVDLKILLVNDAAEKMTGFSEPKIVGMKFDEYFKFYKHPTSQKGTIDYILKAISSGKVQYIKNHGVLTTKSGRSIPINGSTSPLTDESGSVTGCVFVFNDITEELEIEQVKNDIISIVSHQLRTPLTSLRWLSELLISTKFGKLNAKQNIMIKDINHESISLINLVSTFLETSNFELGIFEPEIEEINIHELVHEVQGQIKFEVQDKKLAIKKNIDKKLTKYETDKNMLKTILSNLMFNAVRYSNPKGKITISIQKEKDGLYLSVTDTGVGIPKDQQENVFQKLFRARNAPTKSPSGMGLGLYLTKLIVDHMDGKIWFESQEEKGTTFYVQLPAKITKEMV